MLVRFRLSRSKSIVLYTLVRFYILLEVVSIIWNKILKGWVNTLLCFPKSSRGSRSTQVLVLTWSVGLILDKHYVDSLNIFFSMTMVLSAVILMACGIYCPVSSFDKQWHTLMQGQYSSYANKLIFCVFTHF